MRIFAYLAIYGSVASAEKSKKTLSANIANAASDNSKTIDLRVGKQKKAKTEAPEVIPERVAAPRPPIMSEEELYQKMIMINPPTTDFNNQFEAFALKNQFPPAVQEHRMMEEYARRNTLRKKTEDKNQYLQNLRRKNNKKQISCLTCSSSTYSDCYATGKVTECSRDEDSCFLETRFTGQIVSHVQSGCQQKVACINNMKQNFWDVDGNGIQLQDEQMHHCKLFSGGQGHASVCRNCCFEDDCARGWQPNSFDEWRILPKSDQMAEMMLFDQFSHPPEHWMKAAESRRIEYFTDLDDMDNFPQSKKNKKSKTKKNDEHNAKIDSDGVINLKTTEAPTTRAITRRTVPQYTTRRPTTRATTRRMTTTARTTRKFNQMPFNQRNTLGNSIRPMGAQKQQTGEMQRLMQMRQARMKMSTKPPQTTRTPTRRIVRTTQQPVKSTKISDDDFFNLLDRLAMSDDEPEKDPMNNQMRFSLNVNEEGEVNQMYGKNAEKKNSNIVNRLQGKPSNQPKQPMGNQVINRNQFVQKATNEKTKFGPVSTAQPQTTKKGPWSHLPPWKQRQLKLARQKQMIARQNAMQAQTPGTPALQKQPLAAKPVINKPTKPLVRQPIRRPLQPVGKPMQKPVQPIRKPVQRPGQPIRKPGPGMQIPGSAARKSIQNKPVISQPSKNPSKAPLRRTPVRAPTPSPKKEKKEKKKENKPSAAQPQMMKFSQWASPAEATLEEGKIVEIQSSLSDNQFAAMISSIDTKADDIDFDSLIDNIEHEVEETTFADSQSGYDPRYRLTDNEFADFVSKLV